MSFQLFLDAPAVGRDVQTFQEGGNDDHPASPGSDNLRQGRLIDAPNAELGEIHRRPDLTDKRRTNRDVIRLGLGRVNGADSDVIRAFLFCRDGLAETVGRFADKHIRPGEATGFLDGKVILADVDDVRTDFGDEMGMIVEDEERAIGGDQRPHRATRFRDEIERLPLRAELDQAYPAEDKLLRDMGDLVGLHVAGIDDGIEPGLVQALEALFECCHG